MASKLFEVQLTDTWQSVTALTGGEVVAGMALLIQNKDQKWAKATVGDVQPAHDAAAIIIPDSISRPLMVSEGESGVWLRGIGSVTIQAEV